MPICGHCALATPDCCFARVEHEQFVRWLLWVVLQY